jgi:hypothetical protein
MCRRCGRHPWRASLFRRAPRVGDAGGAGPGPGSSGGDGGSAPGDASGSAGLYGRFKAAVRALKREVLALYYAIHDPRTPLAAKVIPWLALAYALSPLDLIPDFIPVLVRARGGGGDSQAGLASRRHRFCGPWRRVAALSHAARSSREKRGPDCLQLPLLTPPLAPPGLPG